MEEVKFIWMDGKLLPWDEAKVHVLTHTLHYGAGVFEGIRFYETEKGPAIFRLQDHVDRLFNSASALTMEIPFSKEEVFNAIINSVKVNKISSGYIRPIAFFGYGKMGLNPAGVKVNVAIAVWPWGSYLGEKAVKVKTSSFIRIHPKSTKAEAKICGHYVNSIFASLEAKNSGYDEALLLDYEGNVAEGPGENIFIIKDGVIKTPQLGAILPGITRKTIIELAKDLGYEVKEVKLKLEDVKDADEAFFTGTAAEVTSIKQVDDTFIGNGNYPMTEKLRSLYLDVVHGKVKEYERWLTYVR